MKASDVLKRRPLFLLGAVGTVLVALFVGKRLFRGPSVTAGATVVPMSLPILANVVGEPRLSLPAVDQRIVVLDMFETTCGPCKKSLPKAQYRFDGMSDVHFVAVCLDDDRAAAERVASLWGLSKEVAWDEKGEARKQFKVVGIPAMVVIAPNGVVTGNFGYEPSNSELERALQSARDAI